MEDEADLAGLLEGLLLSEGYDVDVARDGQRGLHLGSPGRHDVLVIDRGLPAIEGVDLVRRLRGRAVTAPVLMLTARGTTDDRVEGLDAGAEDYLVKPFDVDELLARLRALLRRHRDVAEALSLGTRTLSLEQRLVAAAGSRTSSSRLARRSCSRCWPGVPSGCSRARSCSTAVFDDADTTGSVDTYVHYLRRKLGRDVVRTVRGSGYRLGSA